MEENSQQCSQIDLKYLLGLLLSSLLASSVVLLCFSPRYVCWTGFDIPESQRYPEINRAVSTLAQIDDPFAPVENSSNRVIRWRLLFPLLAHVLHVPKLVYLALPHVGCVLVLMFVTHLVYRETTRGWLSVTAATLFATTSWFFVSTGWLTYFDSWFVLGLVTATFVRRKSLIVAACLLTPWVDERFILGLPAAMLARAVYFDWINSNDVRSCVRDSLLCGAAVLPYLLARVIALTAGSDAETFAYVSGHATFLDRPLARRVWGAWEGLRANWFLVATFVGFGCTRRRYGWSVLLGAVVFTSIAGSSVIAGDLSRSIAIIAPTVVTGTVLLVRHQPRWARFVLPALLAANLLLPSQHVIITFNIPILSLADEIRRFSNPPNYLNPNYYTQRGMARLQFPDLVGARTDFETALQLAPENSDARFGRALVFAAIGDLTSALRDVENGLRAAPAVWPNRQQAESLLDQLHERLARPSEAKSSQ